MTSEQAQELITLLTAVKTLLDGWDTGLLKNVFLAVQYCFLAQAITGFYCIVAALRKTG